MAKEDEDGVWRTIGGRRVFIREGESLTEAMKNSGKFKKATKRKEKTARASESEPSSHTKAIESSAKKSIKVKKQENDLSETRKAIDYYIKKGEFKKAEQYLKEYGLENEREDFLDGVSLKIQKDYRDFLKKSQDNPLQKSEEALNKIDRLANEAQHYTNDFSKEGLEKKGREMGSKEFEEYVNDLRHESYEKRNSYKQGDVLEYDTNHLGVTPRWHRGEVLSVESGLAGHGDTNPDKVYKVRDLDTENEYKINANAVGKRIKSNTVTIDNKEYQITKEPDEDRVYRVENVKDPKDWKYMTRNELSKQGIEMPQSLESTGLPDFSPNDNLDYSKKTSEIPNRFREGFKVQNSKYSDEDKMTLVEDGSGVRLIYDGKDTGTVLKNDLSENEVMRLRDAGKIQNMSEYLDQMDRQDSKSKENSTPLKTKKDYDDRLNKISKIKEDGTYDLESGKSKNYNDGYQVTFSMTDMDLDDKEYTDLVEKFKKHDHDTVDAGKFEGYPEISFNVTDMKKALKLGYKYNQKSVWDWKKGKEILTGGTGAYADYQPLTAETISKSVTRTREIQNRVLNYEDEIKNLKRKSSLTFTDKQKLLKLQSEKKKLEDQLK